MLLVGCSGLILFLNINSITLIQTESLKFKIIQSQSYRNTSNVMHFGKVYFDPLHVSLRFCGRIYDTKNLKVACLCIIDRALTGIKPFSYITRLYPEKVYK